MIKVNSQSSEVKFDNKHNSRKRVERAYDRHCNERRAKAIAILLGGYNKYGRSIDLDKYKEIKEVFDSAILDIEWILEDNK